MILLRAVAGSLMLLALMLVPAHAQKTKAQLNLEITNQFPDNTAGAITPQILRNVTSDMVNSVMPTAPVTSGSVACYDGTTGLLKQCVGASLSPTPNVQVLDYQIQPTDCWGTVQIGSGATGQKTLTLPASPLLNGFLEGCFVFFKNGDTGSGKILSGFPAGITSPNMLWPSQAGAVQVVGGAWKTIVDPGRWVKQNAVFLVDTGGNNANDGISLPLQSLDRCRIYAQFYVDTQSGGNGGVTCSVTAGQTFQEFVQAFFPLVGGGTLIYQGNGGAFIWKPINSGYALQFGDLSVLGLTNVTFSSAGVTTPQGFVYGHNVGVIDVNSGVSLTPTVALTGSAFFCDFDTHWNVNSGITINAGTITGALYEGCPNSTWNINNPEVHNGSPTIGKWTNLHETANMNVQGNVTFTGAITAGVSTINSNATIINASGSGLPGGISLASNGQYCTSPGSCITAMDASNLTGTIAAGRMPAYTGGDCTSSAGSVSLSCPKTLGSATGNFFIISAGVNFAATGDTTFTIPTTANGAWAFAQASIYNCTANITAATFEVRTASGGGGTLLTAAAIAGTNTSQGPGTAASLQSANSTFTGWMSSSTTQLFFRIVAAASGTCVVGLRISQY